MTIDDFAVSLKHMDPQTVLHEWRWLIGTDCLPILLAAGGDAFLQSAKDGSVHFLEAAFAKFTRVAPSGPAFRVLFNDEKFVEDHFSVAMVVDLRASGCGLPAGKVYSFKHPLALGGDCGPENVETCDIEVYFSLLGQIHRQTRKLPVGAPASSVRQE